MTNPDFGKAYSSIALSLCVERPTTVPMKKWCCLVKSRKIASASDFCRRVETKQYGFQTHAHRSTVHQVKKCNY